MRNLTKALIITGVLGVLFAGFLYLLPEAGVGPIDSGSDESPPAATVTERPAVRDLPPAPTGQLDLRGVVKNQRGEALEGAQVVASILGESSSSLTQVQLVKSVKSDAGGSFRLEDLPVGRYRFVASLMGYQEGRIERTLVIDLEPAALEFVLASGLHIAGRISNEQGGGIAGAEVKAFIERAEKDADLQDRLKTLVELEEIRSEAGVAARSDDGGAYVVSGLEPGQYRIVAIAAGFGPGTLRYVEVGRSDANLTLEPGGVLDGVVLEDETSRPVAGATIAVKHSPPEGEDIIETVMASIMPPLASTVADDSGAFSFRQLGRAQVYTLIVTAPGFQPVERKDVVVSAKRDQRLELRLAAGQVIRGTVYDPDARPLEGARVKATAQGATSKSPTLDLQNHGVFTDANGRFLLDTLEGGTYRVVASHADYAAWAENRISPSSTEELSIHLTVGAAMEGRIVDSSSEKGIPGAIASVRDSSDEDKTGVADSAGRYYLRGVTVPKRGDVNVTFRADGYSTVSNHKVSVVEGQVASDIDMALDRNGSVAGVVVDSAGAPLANVRVTPMRQHSATVPVIVAAGPTALSGADGAFVIENVRIGDAEFVEGSHPEYLKSTSDPFDLAPGAPVSGVKLVMQIGGGVEGRVVDGRSGVPIANAVVAVRELSETGGDPASLDTRTTSDAAGKYRIGNLHSGTVTVVAEAEGYLRGELPNVVVEEGYSAPLGDLALTQGAFIAGVVTNVEGAPIGGAKVTVIDTSAGMRKEIASSNTNGEFRVDNLGQAPVTVEVEAKDYSKVRLQDEPVHQEDLRVVLERHGSISGLVQDEDGRGIAAFSVAPKVFVHDRYLAYVPAKTFQTGDGTYSMGGLMPGRYEIAFGAPGYSFEKLINITVNAENDTLLPTVTLQSGGKIAGWVYDAETGAPIERAGVSVVGGDRMLMGGDRENPAGRMRGQGSTVTNVEGYFELTGLAPRVINIKVICDGYVDQTVKVHGGNQQLTVNMERGGGVRGVVRRRDGTPVANQQILLGGGDSHGQRCVTDRNGLYVFNSVKVGTYQLRVTSFGMPGLGRSRSGEDGLEQPQEPPRGRPAGEDMTDEEARRQRYRERERLIERLQGGDMTEEERAQAMAEMQMSEQEAQTGQTIDRRSLGRPQDMLTFTVTVEAGRLTEYDIEVP